jgi:hypothetical protein
MLIVATSDADVKLPHPDNSFDAASMAFLHRQNPSEVHSRARPHVIPNAAPGLALEGIETELAIVTEAELADTNSRRDTLALDADEHWEKSNTVGEQGWRQFTPAGKIADPGST